MAGEVLLSTAYLPPLEYLSLVAGAKMTLVEAHENYIKQTYRNRCYILSASGPQILSVPVYEGSRHKVRITDTRIDYSKRWQQVHLRAIKAAYGNSPYFDFYSEDFEKELSEKHEFLFELNSSLLEIILKILKINKKIGPTSSFGPCSLSPEDHRYDLLPEKRELFRNKKYMQVFGNGTFTPNLSVIDLIFNMGPEASEYLR